MKILMACYKSDAELEIRYVPELVTALASLGVDVTWSSDEFWCPSAKYDIIHLQWPEAVFDWNVGGRCSVAALKGRIISWKEAGAKIVMTRHNENKHYADSDFYFDLYREAERLSDAIIHLGKYSRDQVLALGYPGHIRHYVMPIHIFPSIDRSIDRLKAREKLKMSPNVPFVLVFGNIRADEERELILDVTRRLRWKGIKVYAPRLFTGNVFSGPIFQALIELKQRLKFIKYGLNLRNYGLVGVEKMSCLFSACDVVFIPRKKILNSGNLSMGFYFGKVVIGPDRGNVGEILRETGNPVFEPDNIGSVISAVCQGIALSKEGKGLENQRLADEEWTPKVVADKVLKIYRDLLAAK